jgi:hypothetical protein
VTETVRVKETTRARTVCMPTLGCEFCVGREPELWVDYGGGITVEFFSGFG